MRPGHVHSSLLAVNQSVSPTESKSTSPLSQHRSFLVRLMITAIDIESKTFLHRSTNLFLAHRAARTIFNSSFNIFFLLFFQPERESRTARTCVHRVGSQLVERIEQRSRGRESIPSSTWTSVEPESQKFWIRNAQRSNFKKKNKHTHTYMHTRINKRAHKISLPPPIFFFLFFRFVLFLNKKRKSFRDDTDVP